MIVETDDGIDHFQLFGGVDGEIVDVVSDGVCFREEQPGGESVVVDGLFVEVGEVIDEMQQQEFSLILVLMLE